jgi:hypothetical protein
MSAFLIFSTLALKIMDTLIHELVIQIFTLRKNNKDVLLKITIEAL